MVSKRDKLSQDKALEAAKQIIAGETSKTIRELAEDLEIGVQSISSARILLHFGNEHEIAIVGQGHIGLSTVVNGIKERVGPEKLAEFRKELVIVSERRRAADKMGAELWDKISLMFKGIGSMPAPKDAVAYIATNGRRSATINAQLDTVANWIREFAYEWQFYQLGKHQEGTTDAGDGDSTS